MKNKTIESLFFFSFFNLRYVLQKQTSLIKGIIYIVIKMQEAFKAIIKEFYKILEEHKSHGNKFKNLIFLIEKKNLSKKLIKKFS